MEEENDELRRRMGALARRNKRKGQVLNSETNSTTSRSHRLSYTKFPTNQRFSSRRKAHVGENTGDLHNQSDDDICDDKVDISNQNQSINVDNIESEESPEQDNIKIIHDSNIAYNIEVCDELISNGLSMEQALHRAISIVSSKVEKRLSNLPGNHSKLR